MKNTRRQPDSSRDHKPAPKIVRCIHGTALHRKVMCMACGRAARDDGLFRRGIAPKDHLNGNGN